METSDRLQELSWKTPELRCHAYESEMVAAVRQTLPKRGYTWLPESCRSETCTSKYYYTNVRLPWAGHFLMNHHLQYYSMMPHLLNCFLSMGDKWALHRPEMDHFNWTWTENLGRECTITTPMTWGLARHARADIQYPCEGIALSALVQEVLFPSPKKFPERTITTSSEWF